METLHGIMSVVIRCAAISLFCFDVFNALEFIVRGPRDDKRAFNLKFRLAGSCLMIAFCWRLI